MNMRSYNCCQAPDASTDISSLAALLKIISEPTRLRILCILNNDEEHCVCEFSEHIQEASQSLLSHHLADLRDAGLVTSEKRGLKVYYRLTERGSSAAETVLSLHTGGINT
jgi:DNA-binding transcriptional ArsR family regulator